MHPSIHFKVLLTGLAPSVHMCVILVQKSLVLFPGLLLRKSKMFVRNYTRRAEGCSN